MHMEWITAIIMFGSFFVFVFSGVPISFSIGLASLLSSFTLRNSRLSLWVYEILASPGD